MARFIVRRLIGMVAACCSPSRCSTFLIFNVIPNGDPAERMAGQATPTPTQIEAIRKEWGFDKPLPAAVRRRR